ncbi:glycosyltransferase [Devosia sp. Leaf420]|uniref:glycosyltransferase n=1 Tax=Devosia sp. Leaf420 TaxID=1736374 RepID=UPI000785BE3F|nr:glycosyltransferase [Devosia sp. Leaf420]
MTQAIALIYETMPPSSGGGSAPRGDAFVRALVAEGAFGPVTVYCATAEPTPIDGVELISVGNQSAGNQRLLARLGGELLLGLRLAIKAFGRDRDVFWLVSTPSYLAMLVVVFALKLRGIRYALDVRDIYPQAYIAAGLVKPGGFLARIFTGLSRRAYAGATVIIAATEGLTKTLRLQGVQVPVHTIINGYSRGRESVAPDLHQRFTVCFHGVLGYFQDNASLLAVGRQLAAHDIDLVVIGYGRDAGLFENVDVPNIRFLGRLSQERTIEEVARCHVGISLRKDEEISADSFPVKVWEYLGLGMPTLVAPRSDAGDFVSHHGCGYNLAAGDIDAAVAHIVALRDDLALYRSMQQSALTAVAPYSRARQAGVMAQLLADAATGRATMDETPASLVAGNIPPQT